MLEQKVRPGSVSTPVFDEAAAQQFKGGLAGRLIQPADEGY